MTDYLDEDIKLLTEFKSISLAEMDGVKLMNRTDTKFVFRRSLLESLLHNLKSDYQVLCIEDKLISSYKTLYFDTDNFQFFLDHHNGKGNRFKVRIRKYVESNLLFFEIKNKFKGRTLKSRFKVSDFEMELSTQSKTFTENVIPQQISLEAKLWNGFRRITLVNNEAKERVTLDLDLSFDWEKRSVQYGHIVIAELKQENEDRQSLFYSQMKKNLIRPYSISKYCIGAAALYPELKYNNFKEKLLLIDKLSLND